MILKGDIVIVNFGTGNQLLQITTISKPVFGQAIVDGELLCDPNPKNTWLNPTKKISGIMPLDTPAFIRPSNAVETTRVTY